MENIDNNGASVNNSPETDTNQDYISAINEMKQNTVSKEQYLKLKEDNRKLLDSLVNGGQLEKEEIKKPVDIEGLREDLYGANSNLSSLEYVSKTLQLRKALMDRGEPDPFVVKAGKLCSPDADDFNKAERVAEALEECVNIADGNPDVFSNEFKRRLI